MFDLEATFGPSLGLGLDRWYGVNYVRGPELKNLREMTKPSIEVSTGSSIMEQSHFHYYLHEMFDLISARRM